LKTNATTLKAAAKSSFQGFNNRDIALLACPMDTTIGGATRIFTLVAGTP